MNLIRYIFFLGFAAFASEFFFGCGADSASAAQTQANLPSPDSVVSIRIAAVGDLMCHAPQFTNAKVGSDTFDFRPCFEEVKSKLSSADFTIGNLETVLAGSSVGYKGYPNFNTPDDYLDALKAVGFDFLSTANNHSLDQGEKGVLRTLEKLDAYGIGHTGTHSSDQDRDSVRVVHVKGMRLAILNYTYGMNGYKCPEGKPWMVNAIDTVQIKEDVKQAKSLEPDLVISCFHWGNEYEHEPNAYQKAVAKVAILAGVDVILGSHPHVIQPIEKYKTHGGRLDSGLVVWSMGNFISNQVNRYTDAGVVVYLSLEKNNLNGKVALKSVSYTPTWVYRAYNPAKKIHVVVPATYALEDSFPLEYVPSTYHPKVLEALHDTEKYLCKYMRIPRD